MKEDKTEKKRRLEGRIEDWRKEEKTEKKRRL